MSEKNIIQQIKDKMGEDKKLRIDIYDDEIVFYLWEREVGICLNKYYNDYKPYLDFEGYRDENCKMTHLDVFIMEDVMKIIMVNDVEILSWINVAQKEWNKEF